MEAGRVGLSLNPRKCKAMRTTGRGEWKLKIGENEVKDVSEFVYLGATVNIEGGGTADIDRRIAKARGAFLKLNRIWISGSIRRHTKIMLFKSLVLSVLLYGCET